MSKIYAVEIISFVVYPIISNIANITVFAQHKANQENAWIISLRKAQISSLSPAIQTLCFDPLINRANGLKVAFLAVDHPKTFYDLKKIVRNRTEK